VISRCCSRDNKWGRRIPNSKHSLRGVFPQRVKATPTAFVSGCPLRGIMPHLLVRVCVRQELAGAGKGEKKGALCRMVARVTFQSISPDQAEAC